MSYDFRVGQFINGEGLEKALDTALLIVEAAAMAHVGTLKSAFLVGGHGDRGGEQWAPWSKSYAKSRVLKGRTNVLMDTGKLRNSIHAQVSRNGDDYTAVIGSNVSYAKYHQFGVNKQINRKAFAQSDVRKRGKWGKNKKGQSVFRKGKRQVGVWRHFAESKHAVMIPARPFLVTTDQDVGKIRQRIVRSVDDVLNGPGGAGMTTPPAA